MKDVSENGIFRKIVIKKFETRSFWEKNFVRLKLNQTMSAKKRP